MKSFLGNFYRQLAIFYGHTGTYLPTYMGAYMGEWEWIWYVYVCVVFCKKQDCKQDSFGRDILPAFETIN